MTQPIENLHVHQWITVSTYATDDEPGTYEDEDGGFFVLPPPQQQPTPAPQPGQPLKIMGISFPFLAVTDGRNRFALDLRACEVTLLHRTYVNAMIPQAGAPPYQGLPQYAPYGMPLRLNQPQQQAPQQTQVAGRYGLCPNCGDRLRGLRKESGGWVLSCKECGFEGMNRSKA